MTEVQTHKSPYTGEVAGAVQIVAPEFTHFPPEGVFPHLARITIEYVPREMTLDADSVGEYCIGFRDERLTQEEAVQKICEELCAACQPMMMNVTSQYSMRNGLAASPQARYVHPDAGQKKSPIQTLGR
jgi:7-cyano-7-deazaguanine reductase